MGAVREFAIGFLDQEQGVLDPQLDKFLMDRAADMADECVVQHQIFQDCPLQFSGIFGPDRTGCWCLLYSVCRNSLGVSKNPGGNCDR